MSPMGINPAHLLMLIVGVLVGLLPLGLLDSSLAVTNDFRAAQAAFERKDYDTAVRLLDTLLTAQPDRSEEHTSELQSQSNLVCRLLLEKKKTKKKIYIIAKP